VGVDIFTNFSFLARDFGSRHARKPFKASKDADYSLVSKEIDPKNGSLVWRPGPGEVCQKVAKIYRHCDVKRRKPHTQNKNIFFNLN